MVAVSAGCSSRVRTLGLRARWIGLRSGEGLAAISWSGENYSTTLTPPLGSVPRKFRWDDKRTIARNGGGLACRGRRVECVVGGAEMAIVAVGNGLALGVGHAVPVRRG